MNSIEESMVITGLSQVKKGQKGLMGNKASPPGVSRE
jgi:hypothetical protein